MKRLNIQNTQIEIIMQNSADILIPKSLTGILSKRKEENAFRFEESVRPATPARNPKLYDGQYISLVRKSNGKYQIYTRLLEVNSSFDPSFVAVQFFREINDALQYLV